MEPIATSENKIQADLTFARDVRLGLRKPIKRISSKYLYDAKGSELFCQIMDQPEYYPTDAEKEIFEDSSHKFFEGLTHEPFRLIELGAGDGLKTKILLRHLVTQQKDFEYIPVDICKDAVEDLTTSLKSDLPSLRVSGAVADYTDFFKAQAIHSADVQNIVLFLGSNIGNFNTEESLAFLRTLNQGLTPGDLVLIGFDLKKDINTLTQAYNDTAGVTARFNLNLLERMNRELGSQIDVDSFEHYGYYNPFSGAMESCLISKKVQDVSFPKIDTEVHFDEFEPIHLEYSFKYTVQEIEDFAEKTGFECVRFFRDSKDYFVDSIWRKKADS